MISYHQMTLADVFTETQELFESDKPEFLKLLESSIDLSELISVTGSTTIDIAVIFPSSRWDITHLVA